MAINHGCHCGTGTVLNAVSARNGSSQNMVAAIANIVTRLVKRTGKAVLQKAGERVYIPIYRLISLVLADRSFMKQ